MINFTRIILFFLTVVLLSASNGFTAEPLLFLRGATDEESLTFAAEAGMTAVYVAPPVADSLGMKEVETALKNAAKHGMKCIIALPTVPFGFNLASPGSEGYRNRVAQSIAKLVTRFKDDPNVIAWATGDNLEFSFEYNTQDFQAFLQGRYLTIGALNQSWGTNFGDFGEIAESVVKVADEKQPFGVGRASVDLADFKQDAFRAVMHFWALEIRKLDTSRPLMTGQISLYRNLIAVPDDYDYICTYMSPQVLDPDTVTHNVHGVDIARRAGKFKVIQTLDLPADDMAIKRGDLLRWANAAALHGASGIAFNSWEQIKAALAPRNVKSALKETVLDGQLAKILGQAPRPTIAFLYEPYASAFEHEEYGVYGYLNGFINGEPNNPFWAFRLGTCFGQVDYLTLNDFPRANIGSYSTIIAPVALKLPLVVQAQLLEFVESGGRVVFDLGAGMYETGSWLSLSSQMAELTGVTSLSMMQDVTGNLTTSWPASWFPSLKSGQRTEGSRMLTALDPRTQTAAQRRPYHVVGPACYVVPAVDAQLVAALNTRYLDGQRIISGLITQKYGSGFSCFATHALWANWVAGEPVYTNFHYDLCSGRPRIELVDSNFWPAGVSVGASADGVMLFNAGTDSRVLDVISYDAGHALFENSVCTFSSLARNLDGSRSGAVRVSTEVPGNRLFVLRRLPVLVQPFEGNCAAQLLSASTSQLELQVGVPEMFAVQPPRRLPPPADLRLTLKSGAYPIKPNSVHQIRVCEDSGKVTLEASLTANDDGELRFSLVALSARITIQPQS